LAPLGPGIGNDKPIAFGGPAIVRHAPRGAHPPPAALE
jgi:hypothetical protein